jgi:protein-S-isoprenylcysteine O-methyltransferase Ste14
MSPERTTIALWIAWLVSWMVAGFWSGRTEKRRGIVAEIFFRMLIWAGVVLLFAPIPNLRYYPQIPLWRLDDLLKWLFAVLTVAGLLFAWWARIHLGRLWSDWGMATKANHYVVDTGPYRLVRHPIYSGLMLALFATASQKGTAVALAGAAILSLALHTRARREERFLRAELGEHAYEEYARRTAMLMPTRGRKST